jgi:ParB family chromosome partitioning protein
MWEMHDRLGEDGATPAYSELLESIRVQGQKQPVLGRNIKGDIEFDVELIYGARRLLAARELAMDLLVEIRDIDDQEAAIEMDIENRVRCDISPYERGLSYKRWLRSGLFSTQAEVSKALGVSEARVSRLLKYADLPAVVVGAFGYPDEIREEWAGNLVAMYKDSETRSVLLRRARSMAERELPSRQIYELLIGGARNGRVRTRARDEIVRGAENQPLFRVRVRTKDVHLIVPRNAISNDALVHITEQLRASLEAI